MKVVLAEKPSVARDIASAVGANERKDGYYEGNGYQVTYAFGHLVTVAEPEVMNPLWAKPWALKQLPMIPSSWIYKVNSAAEKQFAIIKTLFRNTATDMIVCATDAGREGQLIFELIYQQTGTVVPVERFWTSSLTPEAISEAIGSLKPASVYANLTAAAYARERADWIVGLTSTRLYTLLNGQTCSAGRVQTPTLNLIVTRQSAIDNFAPTTFYELIAQFEPGFTAKYITPGGDPLTRLTDRAAAQALLEQLSPIFSGPVSSINTVEKRSKPPALFDLLTLQKEANKRFGYTAQETLDLAQSLYEEHKVLSYPRTESRHLSTDMAPKLPAILQAMPAKLAEHSQTALAAIAGGLELSKSYVDNTKLTDHHAIIPTNKPATGALSERQRNVYELVAARFIGIFLPPQVRDETTLIIKLAEHSFRAQGTVIRDPGWTVVDPKSQEEDDSKEKDKDESQQLPAVAEGDQLAKLSVQLKEGKTSAPKPYDDSSLLTAMKNAGQEIDDEDLAAYMKQSGLGTPATRAAIIERLIAVGYIERKKKALIPTEKGKIFIAQVHPALKDVALTAQWEQHLHEIEEGVYDGNRFTDDISEFICATVEQVTADPPAVKMPAAADASGLGPCPQCKEGVVHKTPKGAGCSRWREGCKFSVWAEQYGKKLTEAQIKELVVSGRTGVIKGFVSKAKGTSYDARLVLTPDYKIILDFENIPKSSDKSKEGKATGKSKAKKTA